MTSQVNEARSGNFLFALDYDRDFNMAVQTSNVVDATLGETPLPNGRKEYAIPSNTVTNSDLIIQFIISEDFREWISMYRWMMQLKNAQYSPLLFKTSELTALDSQNKPSARFRYFNTWITALDGMQYTVVEDSSILVATATIKHSGLNVLAPNGEVIDEQYS